MNSTTNTLEHETTGFGGTFRKVIDPARERATGAIQYGESCVRNHPETAVFSSFFFGLLAGGVIGWLIADSHSHSTSMPKELRSLLKQFKGKLNLD